MKCPRAAAAPRLQAMPAPAAADRAKSLGVTIEATYTVGEYDILILSAKQSGGLETWLRESGYRIPAGASAVLSSYIKQNMRFFVAKVNLKEQGKLGFSYLRPLQVAYESPKFMLPIRLGTVNADGAQELFVMTLTRKGRVETTNYRTVRLPTGMDIPVYVKSDFAKFYTSMFDTQVKRENMSVVFLEYAWDMGWCDPCAADPLTEDELRKLGVFWLDGPPAAAGQPGGRTRWRSGRCRCRGRRRGQRRVRDAAARALRRHDVPRGSGVPGDDRSRELPGPLRAAACVHGAVDVRRDDGLPARADAASRARGADAGESDRLGDRGHQEEDGRQRARAARRGRLGLVAADLEIAARPATGVAGGMMVASSRARQPCLGPAAMRSWITQKATPTLNC